MVQDLRVGNINFKAVDFGDTIRLSERTRAQIQNANAVGWNQCVLIHVAAGTLWGRSGRKNGIPDARHVTNEVDGWWVEEFQPTPDDAKSSAVRYSPFGHAIRSLPHEVCSPGRERDYLGFPLPFKTLMRRNHFAIRVCDLRHREEGGYMLMGNFPVCPK